MKIHKLRLMNLGFYYALKLGSDSFEGKNAKPNQENMGF